MRQTKADIARSLELLLPPPMMFVRGDMVSAVAAAPLVETYKFCPGLALP
jgi:hypothetical protein